MLKIADSIVNDTYEKIRRPNEQASSDRNKDVERWLQMEQQMRTFIPDCSQAGKLDVVGLEALHFEIGDYEKALKYFKRSIESSGSEDILRKVIGLNNTTYSLYVTRKDNEKEADFIGLVVSKADRAIPLEDLIRQADRTLLQAKGDGRKRIVSLVLPEPWMSQLVFVSLILPGLLDLSPLLFLL